MGLKFAIAEVMGYATDNAYVADKYITFDLCTERYDAGEIKRQFIHIMCFGKIAERAKTIILKGGHYHVRGNIVLTKYQDQAHGGVWIERFKVIANELNIVDGDVQDSKNGNNNNFKKSRQYYTKKNQQEQEQFDPYPEKPTNSGHTYSLEDAEMPVEYEPAEIPF